MYSFIRLNSSDQDGEPMYIQMVTALVLQLIQCVVHLPSDKDTFEEYDTKVGERATVQSVQFKNKHSDTLFAQSNIFLFRWTKTC